MMAHRNPSRNCFIPGCPTGNCGNSRSYGKHSLFSGPKDPELLRQWIKKIPRKDKKFSSYDAICDLHFVPNEILTQHIHEGANGQIIILGERKKPMLKPGSIPSIFPNMPKCGSQVDKRRKVHLNRSEEEDPWIEELDSIANGAPTDKITFVDLVVHAKSVQLPSSLWAMQCDPGGRFVTFNRIAAMSNKNSIESDVGILFEGSCVPVIFLRGKPVSPPELTKEQHSLEAISRLLSGLDTSPLCSGTGNTQEMYSGKCHVYIQDARSRCKSCLSRRIRMMADAFSKKKLHNLLIDSSRKQMIQENRLLKRQLGVMKKTVGQLAVECMNKMQREVTTLDCGATAERTNKTQREVTTLDSGAAAERANEPQYELATFVPAFNDEEVVEIP